MGSDPAASAASALARSSFISSKQVNSSLATAASLSEPLSLALALAAFTAAPCRDTASFSSATDAVPPVPFEPLPLVDGASSKRPNSVVTCTQQVNKLQIVEVL
jgi:hypothetical protein